VDERRLREQRGWRFGIVFAAVWLLFLVQPLQDLFVRQIPAWQRWLGVALIAAFAVIYLAGVASPLRESRGRGAWRFPAVLLVLGLAVLPLAGQSGQSTFVFVGVAAQACLPVRQAVAASAGLIGLSLALELSIRGWNDPASYAFSILAASMAMFGVVRMAERNRALLAAQEEQARLVVLEERERMARDLHDILGHSLTVITKKAELARRLTTIDPARAAVEIADVERLAREALRDVRTTVTGSREVTLAVELGSARSALASAGIDADLPRDPPVVPAEYERLFGFAVREAVTNVLRHSAAQHCRIVVTPASVEVSDDGRGSTGTSRSAGSGLTGLRERVTLAGGRLLTESPPGGGFRLLIDMSAADPAVATEEPARGGVGTAVGEPA
jgi:two-component system sensor histidine kinase DesK